MNRRQFRTALILALVLGATMAVVAISLNNSVQTSGTIPLGHPDGTDVYVNGGATMDLSEFTTSDRLIVNTTTGNFSAYSNGNTTLHIHPGTNMTGAWTNATQMTAGSTWIEIYPDSKPRVDTKGDVNALSIYENIALDDGQTDVYYSGLDGGTVSVKFYDLPANTRIAAIDPKTDDILDGNTTDSTGTVEFSMPASSHNVQLINKDDATAPTFSNESPVGQINETADVIEFDISDSDFPYDTIETVDIYFEGDKIATRTDITQNKTLSTTNFTANTLGRSYDWSVEATDTYDLTNTESYSFTVPSKLYVYNETKPSQKVDNVTVNATVTGSLETVDLKTVDTGVIDLEGLPDGESYIFTLTADGYHPKEVYIADIYEQNSVFMLNTNMSSVQNQITLTDRTGEYGSDTVVSVDRVINTTEVPDLDDNGPQWVTIGGDRLGAGGFYSIDLQENARYRFQVINAEGDVRTLSEYTAKVSGEINLEIGSITYRIGDVEDFQWDVSHTNLTDAGHQIRFSYNDNLEETSELSVRIETRDDGTLIDTANYENGPFGEVVFSTEVNQSQWEDNSFIVSFDAVRPDKTISGQRMVGGMNLLDFGGLSDIWLSIVYGGAVLVLAFLVGAGIGVAPALVTIGMASGFAVFVGLAPPSLGFGPVILVVALGAIYMINSA